MLADGVGVVGIGELKPGRSKDKMLPVGTHYVTVNSDVRAFGDSSADPKAMSGEEFTIRENSSAVSITIKTKGSRTGGVGKCVVDSIDIR